MWQSVSVGVLFYVMSLSIGKAALPAGDRLIAHPQQVGQLLLGEALVPPVLSQSLGKSLFHLGLASFHRRHCTMESPPGTTPRAGNPVSPAGIHKKIPVSKPFLAVWRPVCCEKN